MPLVLIFEEKTGFQEQYKFIYDTLEEYCRGIDSRFPVSELANQIKEKTLKDKKLKKNAYALEYTVKKKQKNPLILFLIPALHFPPAHFLPAV
jgi:hypothetical protein